MRVRGTLAVLAALAVVPQVASAQDAEPGTEEDSDTARARALFQQGVEATQAELWEEAEHHFSGSLALRTSPVVAFNRASVLVRLDRIAEAATQLEELLGWEQVPPRVEEAARRTLTELEPRLAHLTVELEGERADDVAMIDGSPQPPDVELAVDPGEHLIEVWRDDAVLVTTRLTLAEGERRSVGMHIPTLDPAAVARAGIGSGDEPFEPEPSPVTEQWWFWTGVGALAVAVVATIAAVAMSPDDPEPVVGNLTPGVLRGRVEMP